MSLLVDVFDVLRYVLEYFGIPTDMLVPVWETQSTGQYRSVVRMIGTRLPLSPHPRVHFQIPFLTHTRHGNVDFPVDVPAIPSLADVMWVTEDQGVTFAKFRNCIQPRRRNDETQGYPTLPAQIVAPPQLVNSLPRVRGDQSPANREALKKISALEEELLRLRAQIALIVAVPPGSEVPQNTPSPQSMTSHFPLLTSTPSTAARCHPPPPPPPPPPPLPPCCGSTETSALGWTKICKESRDPEPKPKDTISVSAETPSMLEVLRDMNRVKLRSVERSPGGTPVRNNRRRSKRLALPSDPAALIAEALKRKFAHRHKEESFDKENHSFELSPFGSPEIHTIPPHIKTDQGRLHL